MHTSSPGVSFRKLGLLATLYASQGLPFGFFAQALPILMRQQNYSLRWIGLSTLLALPWGFKWAWAGLVDAKYSARWGRRRSWILPLQLLNCLTFLVLALGGGETQLGWLIAGCFLVNTFSATQDVATDGFAVEQLRAHEKGLGNGVQVAAYRLGMIVGGSLLLGWLSRVGWTAALLTLAAVLAMLTVPVARHRETSAGGLSVAATPGLRSVWSWLRAPGRRPWLTALVVYKFGDSLATVMYKPLLVDAGLGLSRIAWLDGGLGSAAGLSGALLGGALLMRRGVRQALWGYGLCSACTTAAYAYASFSVRPSWVYATLIVVEHLAGGMATVALFTAMMHFCRRDNEGSDYTVQASVVVVSTGVASALGGFLAEAWGYPALFACAASLSVVGAAVARRGFARANSAVAREPA